MKKIIKRILLIPYFIFLFPLNIIAYFVTPRKMKYFNYGIKDYIKLNIAVMRDDWRNI